MVGLNGSVDCAWHFNLSDGTPIGTGLCTVMLCAVVAAWRVGVVSVPIRGTSLRYLQDLPRSAIAGLFSIICSVLIRHRTRALSGNRHCARSRVELSPRDLVIPYFRVSPIRRSRFWACHRTIRLIHCGFRTDCPPRTSFGPRDYP
jgi:hypothetical protein